jgi:hypothetical protein
MDFDATDAPCVIGFNLGMCRLRSLFFFMEHGKQRISFSGFVVSLNSDMAYPSLSTPSRESCKFSLWLKGSEHPEYIRSILSCFQQGMHFKVSIPFYPSDFGLSTEGLEGLRGLNPDPGIESRLFPPFSEYRNLTFLLRK